MPDLDPNLDPSAGTDPATPAAGGTPRFYSQEEYEAALSAARQQEKDKLYPKMSATADATKAMQAEVAELRKAQKAAEKLEADRQAAVATAAKKAEEAEMSAKDQIARRDVEWGAQIEQIKQDQLTREALLKKELEFTQLQNHTQRRMVEERENIAPELEGFVTGKTVEEVEASIERVKQASAAILESVRQSGVRQRAGMPGVAPASGTNGLTQLDNPGDRQIGAKDIQGMDMDQFGAFRAKLGMDRLQSNTGLFSGMPNR